MYIREIKLILGKSFNRKPKLNLSYERYISDDVSLSQSLEFFALLDRRLPKLFNWPPNRKLKIYLLVKKETNYLSRPLKVHCCLSLQAQTDKQINSYITV